MSVYLSIVVPLFNEEESVEKLFYEIDKVSRQFDFPYEVIFVDDGSTDNTWKTIEKLKVSNPQLRGVKFRRNFGQTSAMVAGFDNAQGQIIITMDGDLQNDPADIPLLLKKIEEGYDIVSGWRKYRKDHFSRVLPSKIANYLISITTGVHLHDYGCSLKAYRADCIKTIEAYGEMHRFFPALASMTGARVTELPVQHYPREFGTSKYGFERIFKVFSDIFAINLIIRFSSFPLKGFAICAIPFLILATAFGVLAVLAYTNQWSSGKTLFFIYTAAMAGTAVVHLVLLGILGELIIGNSDLSHTDLPETTKVSITVNSDEE